MNVIYIFVIHCERWVNSAWINVHFDGSFLYCAETSLCSSCLSHWLISHSTTAATLTEQRTPWTRSVYAVWSEKCFWRQIFSHCIPQHIIFAAILHSKSVCLCVCEQIQQCLDRNNQRQSDRVELQQVLRSQQSEKVRNVNQAFTLPLLLLCIV